MRSMATTDERQKIGRLRLINEKKLSTWSYLLMPKEASYFSVSFSLYLSTSPMVSLYHSLCQTQQMEAQMINSLMAGICPGQLMEGGGQRGWTGEGYYEEWEAGRHGAETGSFRSDPGQKDENWPLHVEWFLTQKRDPNLSVCVLAGIQFDRFRYRHSANACRSYQHTVPGCLHIKKCMSNPTLAYKVKTEKV